jgi:hypothetical protein
MTLLTISGMGRGRSVCWAWAMVLCALLGMRSAPGQEEGRLQRVPFRIDDQLVASGMVIETETRDYGRVDLATFGLASSEAPERAFIDLLEALVNGEVEKAASMHRAAPFGGGNTGLELARQFAESFSEFWPSLRVVRGHDLGPETLFIWEVLLGEDYFRRSFRISNERGTERVWLDDLVPEGPGAVKNVLTEIEQMELEGGDWVLGGGGATFRHRAEIPGTKAYWRFNGFACDWEAGSEAAPEHRVTEFYGRAMRALGSGNAAEYAAHWTPYSREKMRSWVAEMPAGGFAEYAQEMTGAGRRVFFVLEAFPVHVVFYQTRDGRSQYDLVYESQPGGELFLANFYIEGLVDDILKDNDSFVRPVIRPLGGVSENEVAAETGPAANPAVERRTAGVAGRNGAAGEREAEEEKRGKERSRGWLWLVLGLAGGMTVITIYWSRK